MIKTPFRNIPGLLTCAIAAAGFCSAATLHEVYSPTQAYSYTSQIAGFGERWPASPGHRKTEELIDRVLRKDGAQVEHDDFMADTPRGKVPVRTIIGKFHATADPAQPILIFAGHYDTLFQPGFIGANDGGSSAGILLAFADALPQQNTHLQIWLVWTDLEEAVNAFTANDGLYGSRHLAQKLASAGMAKRVKGFFLLDMIGDKDLGVARETTSNRKLQDVISVAAAKLGYSQYFFQYEAGIIDDQVPFSQVGIPAVDVVDAMYGRMGIQFDGMGEFHHANTDTMDKVSERSLEIVGRTMLLTAELLDK